MADGDLGVESVKTKISALIPFLRQQGDNIDATGRLPDEVLHRLDEAGAYRLTELGLCDGGGMAPVTLRDLCDIIMEVAKGNGSAVWSVMINLGPYFLGAFCEEVVKEVLTSPHVGPRIAGTIFQARAKAQGRGVEGGYSIQGSWGFPSNIWHCQWLFGTFAHTDESGVEQWCMALLERSQLEIADDWHVVGLKGSGSNTAYTTSEVFVPIERVVPNEHFMAKVDPLAMPAGPLGMGALVIGCAYGALDVFVETATRRPGWGGAPTIASMASTQSTVAKALAQINLAELALRRAAEAHDRAVETASPIPATEASLMSFENVYMTHQVRRAVEELAIAIGSTSAIDADPLNRFLRDLRVACLHGLMRPEPQAEVFGRRILGLEEDQLADIT